MLSKKSYRQVVKNLEHYRKQHEEDRQENPNSIPIDWSVSLLLMIERVVRENHERWQKDLGKSTLEYLAKQGLLVPYHGGYTFPGVKIPTIKEIEQQAVETYNKLMGE